LVSLFALGATVPLLLLVAVTLVAVRLLPGLSRSLPVDAVVGAVSVSELREPSGRS
jgi:hypothetical protein